MNSSAPTLWSLKNVTLNGRQRPRLKSISTEILAGVTAVIGDSGAGKSSLLNLLVGFERPDAGEVVCRYTQAAGQLPVYWLPPGDGLWSHLTVRQHLEVTHPATADCGVFLDKLLSQFDLDDLQRTRPDDLSQGERARLTMARALASRAAVLVLDEPLVHTSMLRQPLYWEVVRDHCSQYAISLVMASHNLETVAHEADHVLILDSGNLAYSGPPTGQPLPVFNLVAAEMLERISQTRRQEPKTERLFKQNPGLG
jgi:ABC-type multidrug transport system ATPase subunit